VLWLTLLKPTIKSAATEAVNAQMSPLSAAVDKANQQAEQAQQAAGQAASAAAGSGAGSGTGAGAANPTPTSTAAPLDKPVDFRIQTDAAPRADNGFNTFTVSGQNTKPLDITDIQLQNPFGDSGLVEIRRNNTVWLRFGLDNFRDYDDHFVVPVHFNKGDTVTFAVSCKNPGAKHCTPALTFSGRTTS
jgi:type II secretory pathway pseudopilin PulG